MNVDRESKVQFQKVVKYGQLRRMCLTVRWEQQGGKACGGSLGITQRQPCVILMYPIHRHVKAVSQSGKQGKGFDQQLTEGLTVWSLLALAKDHDKC